MIRDQVSVPETHEQILGDLARRVRLGLCSNFSHSAMALGLLDDCGFRSHLDALVISDAIGIRKPRAEIFEAVLGELGVAPEETLHVGRQPFRGYRRRRSTGYSHGLDHAAHRRPRSRAASTRRPLSRLRDRGPGRDRRPLGRLLIVTRSAPRRIRNQPDRSWSAASRCVVAFSPIDHGPRRLDASSRSARSIMARGAPMRRRPQLDRFRYASPS